MATRKYTQSRRAEQQSETRRRIVDAVYALHGEIGPARTTIKAIAERAGVERLTVYRHFADEREIFTACSAHFQEEMPPPDPAAWLGVEVSRWAMNRADHNRGKRNLVLRTLDAVGLGFDS